MSTTTAQTDRVIIVGGGPTGLTLALLLAKAGVPSVLIERDAGPPEHPSANILNTRTMEIFRQIDVEQELLDVSQNILERGNITWVTSLAGRELGTCSAVPPDTEGLRALSPTHTVVYPQNRLEPMLWSKLPQHASIDFRPAWRFDSAVQDQDGVTATVTAEATGEQTEIRGSYLVGCDGASSKVRQCLGIPQESQLLQHMLGIHFHADLGPLVNHRKSILYWLLNPTMLGVLIAHWLPEEWVLFLPYFPPQQKLEDFTLEAQIELIRAAVGTHDLPNLLVRTMRPWTMAASLAESYQQGRMFLAGDAAHTFPPTGGLGLNTGVQDAHNLAWKLGAVLQDRAPAEILDSYESERRPVAKQNLQHSVENYVKMNDLNKVVGVDLKNLDHLRRVQSSIPFKVLPMVAQRHLLNTALRFALRRLALLEKTGSRGDKFRQEFVSRIPAQEPHYRFLGLDLGFGYRQGMIIPESTPQPQAENPIIDYIPSTWPGGRLPHFWVLKNGRDVSIHDVLRADRYAILVHEAGQPIWQAGIRGISQQLRFPVDFHVIGTGPEVDLQDAKESWPRLSEVEKTGAVLVRPDGHVAWRCLQAPADPFEALASVFRDLLMLHASR